MVIVQGLALLVAFILFMLLVGWALQGALDRLSQDGYDQQLPSPQAFSPPGVWFVMYDDWKVSAYMNKRTAKDYMMIFNGRYIEHHYSHRRIYNSAFTEFKRQWNQETPK